MKKVLASSKDDIFAKEWCERIKQGYAKDNLFYKYLNTGKFSYLIDIVFQTEDVCPQFKYLDFMDNPTVENARKLLNMLFNIDSHQDNSNIQKHLAVMKEEMVAFDGGASFRDKIDPIDLYNEYAKIDCLHDVKEIGDNKTKTRYDFAKRLAVLDDIADIYSQMPKKYTKHICQELCEKDVVYHLTSNNATKPLFTEEIYEIFDKDDGEVNVVMDSLIWRRCVRNNVQNGFLAAFLLLALNDINEIKNTNGLYAIRPAKKKGLKTINFITGDFMNVDGIPLIHFIQKFIQNIAALTNAEVYVIEKNDKPTIFVDMIGDVNLTSDTLSIQPNDGRDQLTVNFYPSFKPSGRKNRYREVKIPARQPTFSAFMTKLKNAWTIPYSKNDFCQMMTLLNSYGDDEATKTIKTFAELNFLRDVWKLDIAVENNAYLITTDMLLYTLMQKLGGRGICLNILQYEMVKGKHKFVFRADVRCTT